MPGEHVFSGAVPFVATLASTPFVSVIVVVSRRLKVSRVSRSFSRTSANLANAFSLP